MVQQIVTRRYGGEHGAYGARGGGGIGCSFGRGSDDVAVTLLCRFAQSLGTALANTAKNVVVRHSKMHISFRRAALGLRMTRAILSGIIPWRLVSARLWPPAPLCPARCWRSQPFRFRGEGQNVACRCESFYRSEASAECFDR